MTTFFLIRHAMTDAVSGRWIAGRRPGLRLNAEGRAQADALAARLAPAGIAALYSGPLERARETAEPLARALNLEARTLDAFDELHFGDWTGRTFDELESEAAWRRFNSFRGGTRPPGGELMLEAQARAVAALARLRDRHAGERVAVVSHGDIVKAALAHYAGIHLDLFQRVEISPASVSLLELGDDGPRILLVNGTGQM